MANIKQKTRLISGLAFFLQIKKIDSFMFGEKFVCVEWYEGEDVVGEDCVVVILEITKF